MNNFLVKISYIGKNYCGWQVQKNGVSVSSTVQSAVETLLRKKTLITGCGRTDAGVNAYNYCFNFHTEESIDTHKFLIGLNAILPDDISANEIIPVSEDFHARYSAVGKSYIYTIWNKETKNPFLKDMAYHCKYKLNIPDMKKAAACFLGKHDFYAYMASGSKVTDTVREIYKLDIKENNGRIDIVIYGNGFLYKMVRNIAGTLLYVGLGKMKAEDIPKIILEKDHIKTGLTLPPYGLYFNEIYYSEEALKKAMEV